MLQLIAKVDDRRLLIFACREMLFAVNLPLAVIYGISS
jgi:hypothetical protein